MPAGTMADSAAEATKGCAGGYAKAFEVKGAVSTPKTITQADLQALPQATLDVTYFSGRSGLVSEAYTGPTLYQLLEHLGIVGHADQFARQYLALAVENLVALAREAEFLLDAQQVAARGRNVNLSHDSSRSIG